MVVRTSLTRIENRLLHTLSTGVLQVLREMM
jgi:hypothetical protein